MGYTIGVRISGASSYYGAKGNSSGKVKLTACSSGRSTTLTCVVTSHVPLMNSKKKTGTSKKICRKRPIRYLCSKMGHPQMNDEWLNAVRASDAKIGYGINWIAMRYSDILLMYAEVMNELYGADAANPLGELP